MSRNINNAGQNTFTVTGVVSEINFREGMNKNNKPYRSGTIIVRVDQTYNGKSEISEIPISMFANKFKNDGTMNKVYESMAQMQNTYRSIAQAGLDGASRVTFTGRSANIRENMFVSPSNPETVLSGWRLNAMFANTPRGAADCATFCMEIFIMKMERELNTEGEETGRLKMIGMYVGNRGPNSPAEGNVFTFYVEEPGTIDYIERNWNENDTVQVVGRIRYCSEEVQYHSENSWGEDIPQTSTRNKHELIITKGSDFPMEDDMAYDPEDIKALYADRSARREQLVVDAKNKAKAATATKANVSSGYDWEE